MRSQPLNALAHRLGYRSRPRGIQGWVDILVLVWLAWIYDAINNLGAVRQHLAEQRLAVIREAQLLADRSKLFEIATKGGGVDPVVLGQALTIEAQVDLQGAAADGLAQHFLELGFEEVVRLRGAQRDFQITIVDRA